MILRPIPYTDPHPFVDAALATRYRGPNAAHRNGLWKAILTAAADPASELFHRDSRSGVLYRHTGAAHRSAFWAGFDSVLSPQLPPRLIGERSSDAAVCYEAGRHFGRAVLRSRT